MCNVRPAWSLSGSGRAACVGCGVGSDRSGACGALLWRTHVMKRHSMIVVCMVAAAGLAGSVYGQEGRPERPVEAKEPPVLRGPKVGGERPPTVREDFGGEKMERGRMNAGRPPMREFFDAMMILESDETPDALRLSPEQHEKLEALMSEHRGAMRSRMQERSRDGEGARRARGPEGAGPDGEGPRGRGPDGAGPQGRGPDGEGPRGRGPEGQRPEGQKRDAQKRDAQKRDAQKRVDSRPEHRVSAQGEPAQGAPDGAPGEERPRVKRDRVSEPRDAGDEMMRPEAERQIRERGAGRGGPEGRPGIDPAERERMEASMAEAQTRAWSVLNEGQREYVKREMERIRAESGEEELNKRAQEYLKKRREGAAQGGSAPEQGFGEKGAQDPARDAKRAERAKKLSEMSPEERKAAVEKFRKGAERERTRGEPKPPPPIEEISPEDPE